MQNYYDILGLSCYEDSQDAILLSYKNSTQKLRALVLEQKYVESRLIDLNEAFLVLAYKSLKIQYDYCLSKSSETSELAQSINAIRDRAADFIKSQLGDKPKKRKKNI